MFNKKTYAIGMVNPKTTALFFDRLWVFPTLIRYGIPKDVCMDEILKAKDYFEASNSNDDDFYTRTLVNPPKIFRELSESTYEFDTWADSYRSFFSSNQPSSVKHRNQAIYSISSFYRNRGVDLVPIYFSNQDFDQVNKKEEIGLQLCLEAVSMVDESKLSWEQVIEFRKDKGARNKLIRLRQWFSVDLIKKDHNETQAIIEKKLEEYKWALKKHGIQTFVGGLTSVIPILVGPSFIQTFKSNQLEIALGGIALASGTIAWVTTKMIERQEIKRNEIAYIYDVQKLTA
jgi:hypothetical protein